MLIPKKTEAENLRREKAIQQIKDQEEANKIREKIGIPIHDIDNENLPLSEAPEDKILENGDFEEFKVKHGETDTDVWWHEYGNKAAKKLKESGELEWGKERIYFDIPLADMETLRDLSFDVAKNEKIPIVFKHLDTQKTSPVDLKEDSETTRFVANFASVDDAKQFYQALQRRKEYANMKSDRNLDYHGYNIDGVANYASGYREKREPLKRIVETATQNSDGTLSYYSADGSKKVTITETEYNEFKKQFEALPDPQEVWEKAKI